MTTVGPPPGEQKIALSAPATEHLAHPQHAHLNPKNIPEDTRGYQKPPAQPHSGTVREHRSSAAPGTSTQLHSGLHSEPIPQQALSDHANSSLQLRVSRDEYESSLYPPQRPKDLDDYTSVYQRLPLDNASTCDAAFTSQLLPSVPKRIHDPGTTSLPTSSLCSSGTTENVSVLRDIAAETSAKAAAAYHMHLQVDYDSNGLDTDTIADPLPFTTNSATGRRASEPRHRG